MTSPREPGNQQPHSKTSSAGTDDARQAQPEPAGTAGHSPDSGGSDDAARAAAQLRMQPIPRAVEIADRVLRNALSSPRRSLPVRAHPPYDFVRVSSQVIITILRRHIDTHVVGAAVGKVGMNVSRDDVLEDLTIELFVQYGAEIMAVADQTRHLAQDALKGLLGPAVSADVGVEVLACHVHVSDVTVGDPHLVDPADEQDP